VDERRNPSVQAATLVAMVPRLTPGAHLLRRRDDRWQVGLHPTHRVLVPAGPAPPRAGPAVPPGLLLRSALPPPGSCPPTVRQTLAAVAREAGDAAAAVLDRRRAHVVRVETFGNSAGTGLGEDLLDLCRRTGLRLPGPARPGPRPRAAPPDITVVALVGVGEPPRDQLDPHLREERPHLLVRLVEGRAVVGPFVVPGQTPCLRCTDAHRTDADPSWPLLVEQYVRAVRAERADGVPEPVDAALASLALAWAARDLATFAEGATPTTLASTIELAPRLDTVATERWPPHPRCGCCWG
jgi:bacteriocin biosynthesis cyclodehydratase domain-containing protein